MPTEIAVPVTRARRTGALAYGPDPSRAFLRVRVTLTGPDGEQLDITDRTEQRLGSLSQSLGTELAELVHDDLDLDLDDSDGLIESLLRGAGPGDLWQVVMEREVLGRRTRWERVFTGVLDLPDSLTYQRKEATAELHVFAASKLLERVSAETVARVVTGRTGTVSAGSSTVTVSSTTDILPMDQITLDDGVNQETQVVKAITDATHLKTVDVWTNAFTSAVLALETPFYRFRSPLFLLDELMTAAGVEYDVVGFPRVNSAIPTEMNSAGLPTQSGDRPVGVTIEAGKISVAYATGSSTGRKVATDPAAGFAAGTGATTVQGDWTPYLSTEPTIITAPSSIGRDNAEQAKPICWDYVNGDYWHLENTPGGTSFLKLYKNNVLDSTVDSFVQGNPVMQGYNIYYVEFEPTTSELYISYQRLDGSATSRIWYRPVGGGALTAVPSTTAGKLRYVRGVGLLWLLGNLVDPIRLINTTTHTISDKSWNRPPADVDDTTGAILINMWSARRIGNRIVIVYRSINRYDARIAVWSTDGGDALTTFTIDAAGHEAWYDGVATVYTWPDGEETYILCTGPASGTYYQYLTVGYRLNAIPYANFEGQSVAAALRDLCLIANSTLRATVYGDIRIESRWFYFGVEDNLGQVVDRTTALELPEPMEQESLPLSEFYRASVEVTGTTEAGDSISAIAGDTGASAKRDTIDSQLITSLALASAVAAQWADFLSGLGSQEEVTVPAGSMLYAPLDLVKLASLTYLVVSADTDLQSGEQDLTLLEI